MDLHSLYQHFLHHHGPAAYIASICSAGFGSQTNLFSVLQLQSVVPPDKDCRSTPYNQPLQVILIELSSGTLDTYMINLLLEASSTADRARLLTVPHHMHPSWLSVMLSQGLGLYLQESISSSVVAWYGHIPSAQCAFCP